MNSSSIPNNKGEKNARTLAALPTGGSAFWGALEDGMGEVLVSVETENNKVSCEQISNELWITGHLVLSLKFFVGYFWPHHVQQSCSQRAKTSKHCSDEWMLKSAHHNGKNPTERKTQWRAKSILICKNNQYVTCRGSYEVNWTKKKKEKKKI